MESLEVEAKNISKTYGDRKVVKDVSLSVKTSEVVGFPGPNGAGKTTTFKMLTGDESITAGEPYLEGYSVTSVIKKFPTY